MRSNNIKGVIFLVLASILMSTGGVFIKSIDANSMTIIFVRGLIAGGIFIPFIQWKKIKMSKSFVLLMLCYVYLNFSFVNATRMTTAANAIILQCAAPLWIYLYLLISKKKQLIYKEAIPRLAVLIGVLVILFDPLNIGGPQATMGNWLALSSGICYAVQQYLMEKEYPINNQSVVGLMNLSLAFVFILFFHNSIQVSEISMNGWMSLIFLGVVQIGVAYLFLMRGIQHVSAMEASVIALLEPIFNPIFVYFFVGEVPSFYTILGFVLVLVGVLVTVTVNTKRDTNPIENTQ